MSDAQRVVIYFTEGNYESYALWPSYEMASAYQSGLVEGAGRYGGDGLTGYVLPDDLEELRDSEDVAAAVDALRTVGAEIASAAPELSLRLAEIVDRLNCPDCDQTTGAQCQRHLAESGGGADGWEGMER